MISSLILACNFLITGSTCTTPIYETVVPIYFYRKRDKSNCSNKHLPSAPLTSLHANITTDNEVVLSFEDDTFYLGTYRVCVEHAYTGKTTVTIGHF